MQMFDSDSDEQVAKPSAAVQLPAHTDVELSQCYCYPCYISFTFSMAIICADDLTGDHGVQLQRLRRCFLRTMLSINPT